MSAYVVITGPSGVGKTTVVNELLDAVAGSIRLVTKTTRAPRKNEIDGKDYCFCSKEEFMARVARGEFLEWVESYGNFYGTSRIELCELLKQHPVVFSIVDTRGAKDAKKAFPEAITICIVPESLAELRKMLENRGDAKSEEIEKRINAAKKKIDEAPEFDYTVTNAHSKLMETVQAMVKIITPQTP